MHDPLGELQAERASARAAGDPNADLCCLATVSGERRPTVRTLVLRDVTERWLSVYCSRTSPKWSHLEANGYSELLVFWPSIRRQFRIGGGFEVIDTREMRETWMQRPPESKLLDHYHAHCQPQSSRVPSREALLEGIAELAERYAGGTQVPFPETASGLRLVAESVETWRESPDRIHDRRLYERCGSDWSCQVLVP